MASRLPQAPVCPCWARPQGELSPHSGESAGSCGTQSEAKAVLPRGVWRRVCFLGCMGHGEGVPGGSMWVEVWGESEHRRPLVHLKKRGTVCWEW